MAKYKSSIFVSTRELKPNQISAVAQQRYADAMFLLTKGNNGRLNAAMYLGGFVVECLLKARLLEKSRGMEQFGISDRKIERLRHLVFQSHDLQKMLAELPEVEQQLLKQDMHYGTELLRELKTVCTVWTIYARYSTQQANREDAKRFLNSIGNLKKCL